MCDCQRTRRKVLTGAIGAAGGDRPRRVRTPRRRQRPAVADATSGNQGYAQLVCLIGDFEGQAPTAAAQESLMRMLIFLADRYDIDADPARPSPRRRCPGTVT